MFNGNHVRLLRRERNYSLSDLGQKAGISASYLSEIERGSKRPSLKTIEKIARGLNVSTRKLINSPDELFRSGAVATGNTLPEKFLRIREEHGLNQVQLARKAGLSPGLIGQLEQGKVQPSLQTIEKIAQALEISPCYFIADEEELQQLLSVLTPEIRALLMEPQVQSALRVLCQCNEKEFRLILDFAKLLKGYKLSE